MQDWSWCSTIIQRAYLNNKNKKKKKKRKKIIHAIIFKLSDPVLIHCLLKILNLY